MKKSGNFLKSIGPFIIAIVLQIVITVPVMILYTIKTLSESSEGLDVILNNLMSVATDPDFLQVVNIFYGVAALIIFGLWYRKIFVKPFAGREKNYPSGFSFHTICSIIFLALGLQYVCTLIVDCIARFFPGWILQYNALMDLAGYSDLSMMLIIYSVILAPITEELIFRGLVFRYARHAAPFWVANIWQALLFGVLHMNLVQGIYAFSIGLFLGWVCHHGRGIKYSILVHIAFNFFGCFFSDLISFTTAISYPVFVGMGIVLTIFAIWLFYTDFEMEPKH